MAPTSTRFVGLLSSGKLEPTCRISTSIRPSSIPHGGGGPGVGPIGVGAHLAPSPQPSPRLPGRDRKRGSVQSLRRHGAPRASSRSRTHTFASWELEVCAEQLRWQSSTLTIWPTSSTHIFRCSTPVGRAAAHECILDLRPVAKTTGITAEDVAKLWTMASTPHPELSGTRHSPGRAYGKRVSRGTRPILRGDDRVRA